MRRRRLVITGAAAIAATTVLSGCVGLGGPSQSPSQLDVIGDVRVSNGLCSSGTVQGCVTNTLPGFGEGQVDGGTNILLQLLVAYQLPDAVVAPDKISASYTNVPSGGDFSTSPSYTAELQRLDPAPAGTRWVGYIGPEVSYNYPLSPSSGSVGGRFLLTQPGGQPLRGLGYAMTVGARFRGAQQAGSPARPVTCGPSLTVGLNEGSNVGSTICRDASGTFAAPTRDLGVAPAGPESAQPGELATVPFTLTYAGSATPEAAFGLAATTTLPGADPTPAPGTLVPAADSSNRVQVAVAVPAGAQPGSYEVALTARLANGQTRRGVGTLIVRAGAVGAQGGGATSGPGTGTARCAGLRATILGTAKRDVLRGTAGPDVIAARGGNDLVRGLGGPDVICLGPGNDRGIGGPGSDRVLGEAGADVLEGGAATDQLIGGGGPDTLRGGPGPDVLNAGTARGDRAIGGDTCTGRIQSSC